MLAKEENLRLPDILFNLVREDRCIFISFVILQLRLRHLSRPLDKWGETFNKVFITQSHLQTFEKHNFSYLFFTQVNFHKDFWLELFTKQFT